MKSQPQNPEFRIIPETFTHNNTNPLFSRLAEEKGAGSFALIVFLLSCGCRCSVSLPRSA